MASHTIRLLSEADLPAALALWHATPGVGLSGTSDTEPALRNLLARNPTTCFGLWEGERLIGTVLGGSDGRRGYIYHLAIDPDRPQQGLGRQLIEQVLDSFRSLGIRKVHLFVLRENTPAIDFYRRLGWSERHDIAVFSLDL
jgi:ribosomal protein S18 acetylase RimI-like enzyme